MHHLKDNQQAIIDEAVRNTNEKLERFFALLNADCAPVCLNTAGRGGMAKTLAAAVLHAKNQARAAIAAERKAREAV